MTFFINIGRYGGFYIYSGRFKRVCLGWIAFKIMFADVDDVFAKELGISDE